VLPSDSSLTGGTGGWAGEFYAILNTAGAQSLTATDTTNASLTGTEGGITVYAAVKTLAVAGFPSAITAGVAGSVTVAAKDATGNVATWYTGNRRLQQHDGQAVLPANVYLHRGRQGMHTFSAILKTAGMQSITVKDSATSRAERFGGRHHGSDRRPRASSSSVRRPASDPAWPSASRSRSRTPTAT